MVDSHVSCDSTADGCRFALSGDCRDIPALQPSWVREAACDFVIVEFL